MTKSEKLIFLMKLSAIQNAQDYISAEKQKDALEKARKKK